MSRIFLQKLTVSCLKLGIVPKSFITDFSSISVEIKENSTSAVQREKA
jgi:hypothetical protein